VQPTINTSGFDHLSQMVEMMNPTGMRAASARPYGRVLRVLLQL
jgi:hypothetical protein